MIDIDDETTWPDRVRAWVEPRAERLRGTRKYTCDLAVPLETEDEFRELLAGEIVLADHYTRLLDHEVNRIRREGLKPLTDDLLTSRIIAAHAHCAFDEETKARLLNGHVFSTGRSAGRAGKVCFVLGRSELGSSAAGCDDQLLIWGGEGIFRSDVALADRVRGLGRPAMVVAQLDVSSRETAPSFPPLNRLFVGAVLRTQGTYGEVHLARGVPAPDILGVYQPGDPEYDRYAGLPRT